MSEVTGKLKSNLHARVNAIPGLITTPLSTVVDSIEHLVKLQPVKAVTNLITHAGDGTVAFIDRQADITRSWIGPR